MITYKQIEEFENKHNLIYSEPTGDGVQKFAGGRFFSDEDILLDLEKNIPPGLIELYMHEATECCAGSFDKWLVDHYENMKA